MNLIFAILCGVVCGAVASVPLIIQVRGSQKNLGRGVVAVLFAFLVIQAAMLVVHVWRPGLVAPFGVTATLAFLSVTVVGSLRR